MKKNWILAVVVAAGVTFSGFAQTTPSQTTPSQTTPSQTSPSQTTPSQTTPSGNKKDKKYDRSSKKDSTGTMRRDTTGRK